MHGAGCRVGGYRGVAEAQIATMLTSFLGRTMTFRIVLPSRNGFALSEARAGILLDTLARKVTDPDVLCLCMLILLMLLPVPYKRVRMRPHPNVNYGVCPFFACKEARLFCARRLPGSSRRTASNSRCASSQWRWFRSHVP